MGWQTSVTNAQNEALTYTYDLFGNVLTMTDAVSELESYTYDLLGRETSHTDKNGNITTYAYDNVGNITSVTMGTTSPETTTYMYNSINKLTKQTDAESHEINYTYNLAGQLVTARDQLILNETYTYNPNGTMKTKTDRNGKVTNYTYDTHGRLTLEKIGTTTVTRAYTYDNNSNVLTITIPSITTTRTYDALNRKLTETENTVTITYTYDIAGTNGVVSETITNNKTSDVTTKTYDKAGRLVNVIVAGPGRDETTTYTYNTDGTLLSVTNPNGDTEEYEYYSDNTLQELTNKDENDTVKSLYAYEYDGNKNITSKTETIDAVVEETSYTYDEQNRLATVTEGTDVTTYEYDGAGNRTREVKGVDETTYTYNAKNQLTQKVAIDGTTVYTYDNNGNELTETKDSVLQVTNTYTDWGELASARVGSTTYTYGYNGEGNRIQKGTTSKYVYDGIRILFELNSSNNVVASNVYGTNQISRTSGSSTGYYLYNGHGDVVEIADIDGDTLNTYKYDAFGNIKTETGTFNNPFKYAGYYYDTETGNYYLINRYYNSRIGRFISEDSYEYMDSNDPLSLNLYAYVKNNPLIYVDPEGTDAIIITNSSSAVKQGHTSAIYQDANGDWYYTYWGDKAAAVIRIPDKYIVSQSTERNVTTTFTAKSMASLSNFNESLNKFLSDNGYSNITSNYNSATYIIGDFTASLDVAYKDVSSAYPNIFNKSSIKIHEDGSVVYQGQNSPFNTITSNCLEHTYNSLSKGILANGISVETYMENNGFYGGIKPNNATAKFSKTFMNNNFTIESAKKSIFEYVIEGKKSINQESYLSRIF